jgi:ADP-ribosylglycohydrolase
MKNNIFPLNIKRVKINNNRRKKLIKSDIIQEQEIQYAYNKNSKININKAKGCIYGVIVGDALGARYEFLEDFKVIDKINNDISSSPTGKLEIMGEGFFNVEKGQITDDSEMTLSLLKSLASTKEYNQKDVARKYIEWYKTKPIDIGRATHASLDTREMATDNEDMIKNSLEMNITSLSNGCLMRIAPIGLLSYNISINDLRILVNKECDLTHPNTICKEACYAYTLAIKFILEGNEKTKIYDKILSLIKIPRIQIILRDARYRAEPVYIIKDFSEETYVKTDDKKYQGYIGIALQNSFYELLNGTNFEDSLINILKRGGDTDTNLAIAGGLLGCYYSYENINKDWIDAVMNSKSKRYQMYPQLSPKMIDNYLQEIFRLLPGEV